MFNENDFKEHLETLSKEELINLVLFWRKKGTEQYRGHLRALDRLKGIDDKNHPSMKRLEEAFKKIK